MRETVLIKMKVMKLRRTKLKIWIIGINIEPESKYLSQLMKRLEQELPFQAELRLLTWNRAFDTLMDALKNDSAPDIFSIGTTWVHTLGYLQYLAPLPDSFKMRPLLAPWLNDVIRVNGRNHAVPFLSEVYVLMAKQKTLDTLGIQRDDLKDWDSFFASCMKINESFRTRGVEQIPLAMPLRPELGTMHRYFTWLFKSGWTFPPLRPGMNNILRNEISNKTLNFISRVLLSSGADLKALNTDTQSLMERFESPENVFTFFIGNGNAYLTNMMNKTANKDIVLYPIPSLVPDGKTFGGGSVLTVASACKHQELAWQVVEKLSSEEVMTELSTSIGSISPYEGGFWDKHSDDPNICVLKDEFSQSKSYIHHPVWYVIEQILGDAIAFFFWDSIGKRSLDSFKVSDKMMEELDNKVIDVLNMMWELEEDETGRI